MRTTSQTKLARKGSVLQLQEAAKPVPAAVVQADLPLFDAPTTKPKEAFVWDETKGIE